MFSLTEMFQKQFRLKDLSDLFHEEGSVETRMLECARKIHYHDDRVFVDHLTAKDVVAQEVHKHLDLNGSHRQLVDFLSDHELASIGEMTEKLKKYEGIYALADFFLFAGGVACGGYALSIPNPGLAFTGATIALGVGAQAVVGEIYRRNIVAELKTLLRERRFSGQRFGAGEQLQPAVPF